MINRYLHSYCFNCYLAVVDVPETQPNNTLDQSKKNQIEKGLEALPSYSVGS